MDELILKVISKTRALLLIIDYESSVCESKRMYATWRNKYCSVKWHVIFRMFALLSITVSATITCLWVYKKYFVSASHAVYLDRACFFIHFERSSRSYALKCSRLLCMREDTLV